MQIYKRLERVQTDQPETCYHLFQGWHWPKDTMQHATSAKWVALCVCFIYYLDKILVLKINMTSVLNMPSGVGRS